MGTVSCLHPCFSATIKVSSNEGYASLRNRFGSSIIRKMAAYGGVSNSDLGLDLSYHYIDISSRGLAKLWLGTYWYYYRDTNYRSSWARSLYKHPSNSFIDAALKTKTNTKPGWLSGSNAHYTVRNDAGVVFVDGHPYLISVMSSAYGQWGKLKNLVKAIDAVHTDISC